MSELVPVTNDLVARRQARAVGRSLARLDVYTETSLAQIEQEATLQVGRVQALGYVGKRAMQEVALVSQLEQQLAALVPLATTRLQALGDLMALGAAEILADTVRRLAK